MTISTSCSDHAGFEEVRRLGVERVALTVVDVQNDYCHPSRSDSGQDDDSFLPAVANIQRLIGAARNSGIPIIFTRNWHRDATDAANWKARRLRPSSKGTAGTWGAEFFAVSPASEDVIIDKQRYSAFVGTPLERVLARYGRDVLVVVGFATNVCVESTARHATNLDFRVVVVSDATGTPDGPAAHAASLAALSSHFGRVLSSDMVAAWWDGRLVCPESPRPKSLLP